MPIELSDTYDGYDYEHRNTHRRASN